MLAWATMLPLIPLFILFNSFPVQNVVAQTEGGSNLPDAQSGNVPIRKLREAQRNVFPWHVSGFFSRPPIDCKRLLAGDEEYAANRAKFRRTQDDRFLNLAMDCEAILGRNPTFKDHLQPCNKELDFPLAFGRVVYKDYLMLEQELAASYAPQNWYCYALDARSPDQFHARMRALASCLPNVLLTRKEFQMNSNGWNMGQSMRECMRDLAKPEREWRYLVLLQNHDIQTKTNAELVAIFGWLDGANDISVHNMNSLTEKRLKRYRERFTWTLQALKLFRNASKNTDKEIFLTKGSPVGAVTRQFVDFVLAHLQLDTLLDQFNQGMSWFDEHWLQALSISDAIDAPGGFRQRCYEQGYQTPFIIRRAFFVSDGEKWCHSGHWRHSFCVLGIEDLHPTVSQVPELFINKMMPQFDIEAIHCWHEWMRERAKLGQKVLAELDSKPYTGWPQTRYVQKKRRGKGGKVPDEEVECK